jgi:hypothetical protein
MQTRVLQNYNRHILFWGFLTTFFVGVLLYAYFLNATIVHIVERKALEKDIASVTTHISELEYAYMTLSTDITLSYAQDMGFIEPEKSVFASRDTYAGFAQLRE